LYRANVLKFELLIIPVKQTRVSKPIHTTSACLSILAVKRIVEPYKGFVGAYGSALGKELRRK
jgi:hypothetical protein